MKDLKSSGSWWDWCASIEQVGTLGQAVVESSNCIVFSHPAVRALVVALRQRGKSLPRTHASEQTPLAGDLTVEESMLPHQRRMSRVAHLRQGAMGIKIVALPPLYDAQLLWMGVGGFVLGGYERLPIGIDSDEGTDYAQSWWVRLD